MFYSSNNENLPVKRPNNLFSFLQNKKYRFFKPNKKNNLTTKGIFGASLKSASLCGSINRYGLNVPDPVFRCFEEILKRGLLTEGIFRLSGTATEVEGLLLEFDKPPTYGKYLDLTNSDIHAITGVVKKYLRSLPDSVIPMAYQDKFITLYDESFSDKSIIYMLAALIQQLPKEHFHLIHYIIYLTSKIQNHSEVNMMNSEALAVVLAPVFTGIEKNLTPNKKYSRSKIMSNMGQFIQTNSKWSQIWTLLFDYSDTLLELWKGSILWDTNDFSSNTISCHHFGRYDEDNISQSATWFTTSNIETTINSKEFPITNKNLNCSEELYKVAANRSRQNSLCRSFSNAKKKRLSLSTDITNSSSIQSSTATLF